MQELFTSPPAPFIQVWDKCGKVWSVESTVSELFLTSNQWNLYKKQQRENHLRYVGALVTRILALACLAIWTFQVKSDAGSKISNICTDLFVRCDVFPPLCCLGCSDSGGWCFDCSAGEAIKKKKTESMHDVFFKSRRRIKNAAFILFWHPDFREHVLLVPLAAKVTWSLDSEWCQKTQKRRASYIRGLRLQQQILNILLCDRQWALTGSNESICVLFSGPQLLLSGAPRQRFQIMSFICQIAHRSKFLQFIL